VDAFRYFLIREMTLGRDADFTIDKARQRYEGELANDLGNLLRRLVSMTQRYNEGQIPEPGDLEDVDRELVARCKALPKQTFAYVDDLALNEAVAGVVDAVGQVNRYLERTAPWKEAKAGENARVGTVLYVASEALRLISVLLNPLMPERTAVLWERLGWHAPTDLGEGLSWGLLEPGTAVVPGEPLFPREDR
jgi:methionyl-tRNA synthetase